MDTSGGRANAVRDLPPLAQDALPRLLADARGSLKRADAILADVQGASADLGALRAEVEMSLRKTSRLIDEINRKWPFSRSTEISPP